MQRFITIVKSMTEEKNEKLKSLIRFHSDKKLTTATEGGGGKGGGEKPQRIYRTSLSIRK